MKKTNALWILILLVMFPQFVETIYSPALPLIAREFGVNEETATLTISFTLLLLQPESSSGDTMRSYWS